MNTLKPIPRAKKGFTLIELNAVKGTRWGNKGFTLIELLAVMAIVGVLAAIVSVAVSGTGQTSRDTQVQEDANSAGNAVADFFDDQPVTELLETLKPTFPIWLKSFLSNSSMAFQPLSNYGPSCVFPAIITP